MDNETFLAILHRKQSGVPHDSDWAMLRLIEYGPYAEIRRLLPMELFLANWPQLAPKVRSCTRREGMDFFYEWHQRRALSNE